MLEEDEPPHPPTVPDRTTATNRKGLPFPGARDHTADGNAAPATIMGRVEGAYDLSSASHAQVWSGDSERPTTAYAVVTVACVRKRLSTSIL